MRRLLLVLLIPLATLLVGWVVWRCYRIPLPPPPLAISGTVADATGPIAGARVRLQGQPDFTLTDEDGRFALPAPESPQLVTAWKAGHFLGSAHSDETPLNIRLNNLPGHDQVDYRWVDPRPRAEPFSCANCHRDIFDEWQGSAHGRPAESSRFRELFLGIDARGRKAGWSLMKEYPAGADVCASCHDPAPLKPGGEAPRFGNVHCDFCHKVAGPSSGELGLTHGKFGLDLLRPTDGQLIFGPLEDSPRPENTFSAFQKESRLCASCHEGVVFGVRVYETYSEWQASPAGRAGTQCQECHMKPTGKLTNLAPGHGGIDRDPATLANHHFFDRSQRDMLQRSLHLALNAKHGGGATKVTIEVTAEGAGHRLPTGLPDRNLTLLVEAFDAAGKPLAATAGPALPEFAAPAERGQPGRLFAKVLQDWQGHRPVPFWRAAPEFDDMRLIPGQTERTEFTFPAETATVKAKLIYRHVWPEVTRAKSWPDDAWVVAENRTSVESK